MVTLEQVLDSVMLLEPEQQEALVKIVRRRQIEKWRKDTSAYAREAVRTFHAGELKPQSAENVISQLKNFSDEVD